LLPLATAPKITGLEDETQSRTLPMNNNDAEIPRRRGRGSQLALLGLAGTLVLLFAGAGYLGYTVYAWTTPVSQEICCSTPEAYGLPYETVRIDSCDDSVLAGWYLPAQNGAAVILLHGYGGTRADVLPQAAALAEAGYGVLLYDLRGHGESSAMLRSNGWDDVGDVYNAYDWLVARAEVTEERVGLYGLGVGGQIALRAAAFSPRLGAIVAEDPTATTSQDVPPPHSLGERLSTWRRTLLYRGISWRTGSQQPLPVSEVIVDIAPRPLLLIASGSEGSLGQRTVAGYYSLAGDAKELWLTPEAEAGQAMAVRPDAYARRLIAFFDSALATHVRGES
jgi:pimeloyl-ACP methyl ester carboxylesterase